MSIHFNSNMLISFILTIFSILGIFACSNILRNVDPKKSYIWGHGLESTFNLPVRYFYIQLVDNNGDKITQSIGDKPFFVRIHRVTNDRNLQFLPTWIDTLNLNNGTYLIRFRPYDSARVAKFHILYRNTHVADSPYIIKNLYHEFCDCPIFNLNQFMRNLDCPVDGFKQIDDDLKLFLPQVDVRRLREELPERFSQRGAHSLGQYIIKDNRIFRKTYGEHVGFKMFSDQILLSLRRKVRLPDIEFFMNFGDWPLEFRKASENPQPIWSWCGSEKTKDIILPTYDLMEATVNMMDRVTLDIMSCANNSGPSWDNKIPTIIWRGRDSRQERLDFVILSQELAKKTPKEKKDRLIDARLTHMFFFPYDEKKYGSLVPPMSFFDFFKYKYQINIDGTVAAYRFPYLLAGGCLIFKQDSSYYEHFYHDLKPYVHYVPIKADLSDILEKLQWAKDNDKTARKIAENGRTYALDNLMPHYLYCYHLHLIKKWSKMQSESPEVLTGMEEIHSPTDDRFGRCHCFSDRKNFNDVSASSSLSRDEL